MPRGQKPGPRRRMPTPEAPDLLTMTETIAYVRLSRSTIYDLERLGRFPARINLTSRRIAFRRSELDAFLANAPRRVGRGAAAPSTNPERIAR